MSSLSHPHPQPHPLPNAHTQTYTTHAPVSIHAPQTTALSHDPTVLRDSDSRQDCPGMSEVSVRNPSTVRPAQTCFHFSLEWRGERCPALRNNERVNECIEILIKLNIKYLETRKIQITQFYSQVSRWAECYQSVSRKWHNGKETRAFLGRWC